MERRELIRRLVINSICDDFENVDQVILRYVTRDGGKFGLTIERSDIVGALKGLIEDGLAKAYDLSLTQGPNPCSGELPGMPPMDIVEENFKTYFLLTEKGMEFHLSDDSWWPVTDPSKVRPHRRYSGFMRPLRYSINVTLDGCCDHRAVLADQELHRHAVEKLNQADALIFGRVTYEMMEAAFRLQPQTEAKPEQTGASPDWMESFARTIDAAKKYVVSSTLDRVDWNAELLRGDLATAVQQLKREPGKGLLVGGVKLPQALAELGLIDEYEFVVHPRLAGHGPTLFAGLSKYVDLRFVGRLEYGSGAVAMRYELKR